MLALVQMDSLMILFPTHQHPRDGFIIIPASSGVLAPLRLLHDLQHVTRLSIDSSPPTE
jgi:hypothetical protein